MDMEVINVENAKKDLLQSLIWKNMSGLALERYCFHKNDDHRNKDVWYKK